MGNQVGYGFEQKQLFCDQNQCNAVVKNTKIIEYEFVGLRINWHLIAYRPRVDKPSECSPNLQAVKESSNNVQR